MPFLPQDQEGLLRFTQGGLQVWKERIGAVWRVAGDLPRRMWRVVKQYTVPGIAELSPEFQGYRKDIEIRGILHPALKRQSIFSVEIATNSTTRRSDHLIPRLSIPEQ